jgi:hypothetical protein
MNIYIYDYISHTLIETLSYIVKYRAIGIKQYNILPIKLAIIKDSFHCHFPLLYGTVWLDYLKHIEKYT